MRFYFQAEAIEDRGVCRGVAHLRASVFVRLKSSRVPKFQRLWLHSLLKEAPPRSLYEWCRKPSLSHARHHAPRQQTHIWVWMCVHVGARVYTCNSLAPEEGFVYPGSTRLRHCHARAVFPKKKKNADSQKHLHEHVLIRNSKHSTINKVSQNKNHLRYPLKMNTALWNATTSGTRADPLFHAACAVYLKCHAEAIQHTVAVSNIIWDFATTVLLGLVWPVVYGG